VADTQRRDRLQGRALAAIISHAVFRLESAITIALTLILVFLYPNPFYWWQWWYWLVLGAAGEAGIVITSIFDATTAQQVVADMFRETYNPAVIQTAALHAQVVRALEYQRRIGDLVARTPAGPLRDRVRDSAAGIGEWIGNIFNLARRLDTYERDELIHQDARSMQAELQDLQVRLARERDEAVRAEIEEAIRAKEQQRENLERLRNTMERARVQLEASLTALGTVYSQLLLVGARDVDSAHARRVSESINEQVATLNDLLEAMSQVYSGKV